MTEIATQLEEEYCPPLDTATFLAILSDYDLDDPTSQIAVRQILDALKAEAIVEENSGFDPSGSYEDDTKILCRTFPGIKRVDIENALKTNSDTTNAIDELLNRVFLDENGLNNAPKKTQSKWDKAKQEIEFVTSRTYMTAQQVGSIYHKHGASLKATINAIIDAQIELGLEESYPNAAGLSQEFEILHERATALVGLTYPSMTAAYELAEALTEVNVVPNPIQLTFRPVRMSPPSSPKPRSHNAVFSETPKSSASYASARNTAFSQAAAYHRKGKSDKLMGGAAAYYADLGRDLHSKTRSRESEEADELVDGQSTAIQLDLHGVNVRDGQRIARERVTAWWAEKQDSKGVYTIVTGVGNHSAGGIAKLGPAVGAMLIREGWKVEAASGLLIVSGVAKKK